jgi:hypothetical protein
MKEKPFEPTEEKVLDLDVTGNDKPRISEAEKAYEAE